MREALIIILIAAALSGIATPFVKRLACKWGVVDVPGDRRRIHTKTTPLMGGVAIYLSFILVLLLVKDMELKKRMGIIIGGTIITAGGLLDDKYNLKPVIKLCFQIAGTLALISSGVMIRFITNPLWGDESLSIGLLSIPITILWVVGITNALNLIDGLDGLAAGIACISSFTILVVALMNGRSSAAVMSAILCGAILGFLPYNYNPASIFLGDTGSQLLGFLLATIAMEGAIKSAAVFSIAVPILALGLPISDTLFAMIRRKVNGKPIMQGDRGHLHHRLLDMGLSQRKAVLIMYLISAVLGSFAILAMEISNDKAYFMLGCVICILVVVAWKLGFFKSKD